ncbi:TolC family protein [Eleftheria terrae]|uniref:TolC family protein n=1 Tax=Eleftheria terrae TaxID=1597781 RepID=UPI00263BA447|nr:TolC family protein [Eleftheria terrae]WKB55498.1 TolC family protein [Eleftheria terrae]
MRSFLRPLALAALAAPAFLNGVEAGEPPGPVPPTALAADPSPPATGRRLSLADALALAFTHHPELAAARREVEAAEAARLQAAAWPNPQLGIEWEDPGRQGRSTTVQLSQPIEWGGQRPARIEAAEQAHQMALARLAARRVDLRAAVHSAFVEALVAQEQVRIAEADLQLAQRASDAARRQVLAGKVSPIEQSKAGVAEAGVRLQWLQAQSARRTALGALAAAIGQAGAAPEGVDGQLALPPRPPTAARPATERLAAAPALRQARLEVQRLAALAALEQARSRPDLTLTVGAKRSGELGRQQAIVGLALPLPLFDRNQGAHLEALRRQDQAADEAQALALRLQTELSRAEEGLATAQAEAEMLQQEVLPAARQAHDAAAKGFELGKFEFRDVLDAQRTLLEARARHLRALAESHRAAAEIDRLTGVDDPTAATPPLQMQP